MKKVYKKGIFWDDIPPPKERAAAKVKRAAPEPVWLRDDYLPNLEESKRFPAQRLNFADIAISLSRKQPYAVDVEVYQNYFLAMFTNLVTGAVWFTEMSDTINATLDIPTMTHLLDNAVLYSFNGMNYDMPILALAVKGCTTEQIKQASDEIIVGGVRPWNLLRAYKAKKLQSDHIDLIEVAPLRGSLKVYAGRLHAKKMQDLPFAPSTYLTEDQIAITRWYCVNDTYNTALLRDCLKEHIDLRYTISREIGVDVRSKSDAQIAEAVVGVEFKRLTGIAPSKPEIIPGQSFRYKPPEFISFFTPLMKDVLRVVCEADFVIDETENLALPQTIKALAIPIAGGVYRMGNGGLHSSEKSVSYYTNDDHTIVDKDVTSFYPFIILNQGLYPKHLGPDFLTIYRQIVDRRVAAKRNGDKVTADSLKIVINGLFGKFGSSFSVVYAPELLIQTTITGQLSMLMLIEALELNGITVISANTDGMVIQVPKDRTKFDMIVAAWERQTAFETEETIYKSLHCRDVNNYIAIKEDGTTKTKGAYANPWASKKNLADRLHKNPTATICTEAVERYLVDRTPIRETICKETDLRKFLVVRSVRGGAVKVWDRLPPPAHATKEELIRLAGFHEFAEESWLYPGESDRSVRSTDNAYKLAVDKLSPNGASEYLGKTVRWYHARNVKGDFVYALTGNKVPKSDGAKPVMVLPDAYPDDIDYDWYIDNAVRILHNVGAQ